MDEIENKIYRLDQIPGGGYKDRKQTELTQTDRELLEVIKRASERSKYYKTLFERYDIPMTFDESITFHYSENGLDFRFDVSLLPSNTGPLLIVKEVPDFFESLGNTGESVLNFGIDENIDSIDHPAKAKVAMVTYRIPQVGLDRPEETATFGWRDGARIVKSNLTGIPINPVDAGARVITQLERATLSR